MSRRFAALLLVLAVACDAPPPSSGAAVALPTDAPVHALTADAAPADAGDAGGAHIEAPPELDAEPTCGERIQLRAPDAPSESYAAYRARLPAAVVNGRVTPVAFSDALEADPAGAEIRETLAVSRRPGRTLGELRTAHGPEALRAAFLRQGYFVVPEQTHTVRVLARLRLEDLFEAPAITRARGDRVETLQRSEEGHYLEADGSRARLRFYDRVALPGALGSALHFDLAAARDATGALRVVPTSFGPEALGVQLSFPGGDRSLALLERRGGRTHLACVGASARVLLDAALVQRRQTAVRDAAEALVAERPRFDEPIDEPDGVQEDGQLRRAWYSAYRRSERTFHYREVEYRTFDHHGAPVPPQVCVDFVFDAWERGGGAWFRPFGAPPGREVGEWALTDVPRRSVRGLVGAAITDPRLEHYEVPQSERVSLGEGQDFVDAMERLAPAVEPGDALVVYGLREQDMRNHFHALLVLEVDPITGIPSVIADNQGRPALRNLRSALAAAPRRAIEHRVRPDFAAFAPER